MQAITGQPSHDNDASAPLRIAVVAPPWFEVPPEGYGGIEAMCATLVNKLVSRGHEVFLLGAGRDRTRGRFVPVLAEPPSIRLGDPMVETSYASRSARALRELDVDVVHDHCLAGPLSAAGRFAPTVVTVHGPVHADLGDYYRALDDTIGLVAISEAQRRHAPDLPWEGTVHNGVVVDDFPFRDRAAKEDCGTPVVALRRGAVPEVVADGISGLLCDRPAELPAAIDRAVALNPARCRRHAREHFDVAVMAAGYERVYQRILTRVAAAPA